MIATGSVDRSLIRFCLGTAEGLGPAVTNVSPFETLAKVMKNEE